MNKKLLLALLVGGATILTGCNKKISQFDSKYFSVNLILLKYQVKKFLEQLPVRSAKIFVKNAEVTVTPYLNVNGTEIASQPYSYQGEKFVAIVPQSVMTMVEQSLFLFRMTINQTWKMLNYSLTLM